MKKILAIIAISIPFFSNAQVYLAPSVEKGWGYASKATGNFSGYNKSEYQNVGLQVKYAFHKNLSIFTGMGIGIYNDKFFNYGEGDLLTIEQSHFEIPLGLRYRTDRKQKVNFTGSLGVKMGILNRSKSYGYDGIDIYNAPVEDQKTAFQRTTSIGVLFAIKQRNYLSLELFNNMQIGSSYLQAASEASINYFGLKASFAWTPLKKMSK